MTQRIRPDNMAVYKYMMKAGPDCTFDVPVNATILHVAGQRDFADDAGQNEYPCIWMLVSKDIEVVKEKRRFIAVGTGDTIPSLVKDPLLQYKGSVRTYPGRYVYHVFEVFGVAP